MKFGRFFGRIIPTVVGLVAICQANSNEYAKNEMPSFEKKKEGPEVLHIDDVNGNTKWDKGENLLEEREKASIT